MIEARLMRVQDTTGAAIAFRVNVTLREGACGVNGPMLINQRPYPIGCSDTSQTR